MKSNSHDATGSGKLTRPVIKDENPSYMTSGAFLCFCLPAPVCSYPLLLIVVDMTLMQETLNVLAPSFWHLQKSQTPSPSLECLTY